jgi:hypothetical protein
MGGLPGAQFLASKLFALWAEAHAGELLRVDTRFLGAFQPLRDVHQLQHRAPGRVCRAQGGQVQTHVRCLSPSNTPLMKQSPRTRIRRAPGPQYTRGNLDQSRLHFCLGGIRLWFNRLRNPARRHCQQRAPARPGGTYVNAASGLISRYTRDRPAEGGRTSARNLAASASWLSAK